MKEQLLQRIADRTLRVGVMGLGYVGLPLAVQKAQAGFTTLGFDVNAHRAARVNAAESYIDGLDSSVLGPLVHSGRLSATADLSRLSEVDCTAICVPTPLDRHQQPDTHYIRESAEALAPHLRRGSVVVLESTTYPGTTEELLRPILERGSGLICGKEFYLGFSPERVDPGNRLYRTGNTPKVVGAVGEEATEVIAALYRAVLGAQVLEVSSPAVAEMEKILENVYRNVNIALINEFSLLCHRMGIDVWEVIGAAKTKPYGFEAFYPGVGVGGHCIPLDPFYLSWKAKEYGFHTSMIEAAAMVNDRMPEYCAGRAAALLNRRGRALNGSRVLVLGVAYKQDISDIRESPALKLLAQLRASGAQTLFYDPHVSYYRERGCTYVGERALTGKLLEACDLVVVATAHSCVDYRLVAAHAPCVLDLKNALKDIPERSNIERL